MTVFWIIAAGLTLLALTFVVLPLLRPAPERDGPDQNALNLDVFRQRLAELDADLASGALGHERYDSAKNDLERELLYDLGDATPDAASPVAPARHRPAAKGGGMGKRRKTASQDAQAPKPPAPERSPILALLLAVALPVAAVATYLQIGYNGIIPRLQAAGSDGHAAAGADGRNLPPLEVLVENLAAKMEQNPDNLEGWLMLGRTYFAVEQPQKALGALERAYALAPKQPAVLVAYAEAIATNSGNRLAGRPAELIQAALAIDPTNPSARWLDGMRAYQEADFSEAATTWQQLLDKMDPAGQEAGDIEEMIAEARSRAGESPLADAPRSQSPGQSPAAPQMPAAEPTTAGGKPQHAASDAALEVSVTLDPTLAERVSPNDSLFIFARAAAGPPMPLAVQRLQASDLPARVTLDDSMAMMPAMRLSAFPEVVVGARISKTGQATPQSGDLEGSIRPVATAEANAVSVVIDQVRP